MVKKTLPNGIKTSDWNNSSSWWCEFIYFFDVLSEINRFLLKAEQQQNGWGEQARGEDGGEQEEDRLHQLGDQRERTRHSSSGMQITDTNCVIFNGLNLIINKN